MKNEDLPHPSELLPGTAKFSDHPGFAEDCEIREVVVAKTGMTNNGFRCHMTGGHCVPGSYCVGRRERAKEMDSQEQHWSTMTAEQLMARGHKPVAIEYDDQVGWTERT